MRAGRVWTGTGTEAVALRPHIGHIVSGAGHLGLMGWVLFGAAFAPAPDPFDVTEVAVISGAEFAAMMAAAGAPDVADVPAPAAPTPAAAPPPVVPPPDLPTAPPAVQPAPPSAAEVTDDAPVMAPPLQDVAVLAPERSVRPVPRPVDRVAPEPVAEPDPDTRRADTPEQAVTPEPAPNATPVPDTPRPAAAPEAATTAIATEAKDPLSAAPLTSLRPRTRPAVVPAPDAPVTAATPAPDTAARDAVQTALAQALAQAATQAAPPATPPAATAPAAATGTGRAAAGPPLTAGEKDALRVAVQKCWNVGALSSDALRVTVTVGVQLDDTGRPLGGSIRMLGFDGGSEAAARQAFQAASRAISRCGTTGFDLPRDKYDQWRDIEMVFNPEKMRVK